MASHVRCVRGIAGMAGGVADGFYRQVENFVYRRKLLGGRRCRVKTEVPRFEE